MNDKELADRIVALGVSTIDTPQHQRPGWRDANEWITNDVEIFVRDWRVAGALMEKASQAAEHGLCKQVWRLFGGFYHFEMYTGAAYEVTAAKADESLPRAIIEACVDALDEDQQ